MKSNGIYQLPVGISAVHDQRKAISAWVALGFCIIVYIRCQYARSKAKQKCGNNTCAIGEQQIQITQIRVKKKNEQKCEKYIIRKNFSLSVRYLHTRTHVFRVNFTCELNYLCDKQINMDHSFIQFLYVIQTHRAHTQHQFRPRMNIPNAVCSFRKMKIDAYDRSLRVHRMWLGKKNSE